MREVDAGGEDVLYLLGDHLGSTSLVLNSDGTVHSEARYYPYGRERWSSGTLPTDYRFTGQLLDGYIKLVQMGARWYDPSLGRFLSPDSIVPDFSNPQSFNRYSYVYNRPLVAIDTSGHIGLLVTALIGAAAGAVVSYGAQVVKNWKQNGQLTVDAFTNIDGREIAKGALVGFVAGGTMGLGLAGAGALGTAFLSPTVATEVIVTGYAGAFSGWCAGRAEHLVNATYAEYDRWRAGQSFEFSRLWDDAVASGIIDTRDMFIDTGLGIGFAWAGKGLSHILEKAGLVGLDDVSSTTTSDPSYVIGFRPGSNYITLETARGAINLSLTQFDVFLSAWMAGNNELAQEIMMQALEEATTD